MRFEFRPSIDDIGLSCEDLIDRDNGNVTVASDVHEDYQVLLREAPRLLKLLRDIVAVDTVDRNRTPLMSCQGQAMDGYTKLANYEALVSAARPVVAEIDNDERRRESQHD